MPILVKELLDRFGKAYPIPVAVRAMTERVLVPEKLDHWFDMNADQQYTRKLLFSTLFELMGLVVFKVFPSLNASYQSQAKSAAVSVTAIYDKLNGLEPAIAAGLVHDTAREMVEIVEGLGGRRTPLLPGYAVKMLDGNCIAKTEHRLEVLRYTQAGPLPGKSLAVYDHALDMVTKVFPCEDGHAQERSLLSSVVPTVQAREVWVADRNFCVRDFLTGISLAGGFFVIRLHGKMPIEVLGEKRYLGQSSTGRVYEQAVKIRDSAGGNEKIVRLVTIQLKKATRDGDKGLEILTSLESDVDAKAVAELYRQRWSIETMFQKLTTELKSEIDTLGYPRAALFGFCIALVAYNLLSTVKAAMRSVHGEKEIEENVSGYYLAGEIARVKQGMEVALPAEEWLPFREMPFREFIGFLKSLMKNVELSKYKKHKRGVKKPLPKRDQHANEPHVSTYKLLNEKKMRNSSP